MLHLLVRSFFISPSIFISRFMHTEHKTTESVQITGFRIVLNLPIRSTIQASCWGTKRMPKLTGVFELEYRTLFNNTGMLASYKIN
jgi:hypothetical protein